MSRINVRRQDILGTARLPGEEEPSDIAAACESPACNFGAFVVRVGAVARILIDHGCQAMEHHRLT